MAEIEWIKLNIDMFDNRKIKYLRKLPEGNSIVLIWVMLLTIAGRCNAGGYIFLTENVPYDLNILASELDFKPSTLKMAIDVLAKLGMIEYNENQFYIPGWAEYQNIEGMERAKEQNRRRVAAYRDRKRLESSNDQCNAQCNAPCNVTGNVTVMQSNAIEEEYRIESQNKDSEYKESEEDFSDNCIGSKDPICRPQDVRRIMEEWNRIGVSPVMKITSDSSRGKMLRARIKEYGIDRVLEAINRISRSPFLMGVNDKGWQITFEWFVKPNNFIKVLEGNYDARHGSGSGGKDGKPRAFTPTNFDEGGQ